MSADTHDLQNEGRCLSPWAEAKATSAFVYIPPSQLALRSLRLRTSPSSPPRRRRRRRHSQDREYSPFVPDCASPHRNTSSSPLSTQYNYPSCSFLTRSQSQHDRYPISLPGSTSFGPLRALQRPPSDLTSSSKYALPRLSRKHSLVIPSFPVRVVPRKEPCAHPTCAPSASEEEERDLLPNRGEPLCGSAAVGSLDLDYYHSRSGRGFVISLYSSTRYSGGTSSSGSNPLYSSPQDLHRSRQLQPVRILHPSSPSRSCPLYHHLYLYDFIVGLGANVRLHALLCSRSSAHSSPSAP